MNEEERKDAYGASVSPPSEERQSNNEKLYNLFHDRVSGFVSSRVHNRHDAEDITADIFLKLYSLPEPVDPERKGASTYIFKVTQSVLCDYMRKKSPSCELKEDSVSTIDPSSDLDDMLSHLDKALGALTLREREIVVLRYYDELPHMEIASRLGLSCTNVRQICHNALKKLKREIERLMNERGDDELVSVTGGLNLEYASPLMMEDEIDDAVNKGGCGAL